MTKEELKKIAGKYLIFEDEMIDAIRFVSDLLKFEADEIRKRAPYATFNIKHLEQSAYEVWNLEDYINEALEDDK